MTLNAERLYDDLVNLTQEMALHGLDTEDAIGRLVEILLAAIDHPYPTERIRP